MTTGHAMRCLICNANIEANERGSAQGVRDRFNAFVRHAEKEHTAEQRRRLIVGLLRQFGGPAGDAIADKIDPRRR